jgi:S1-C subfamily serine protease
MAGITLSLANRDEAPDYIEAAKPAKGTSRGRLRVYLGTVPDYASRDVVGVELSGVTKGGPAEKAGLRGGDIIVQLAGKKIENIYDYTYSLDALKVGEVVDIVVQRGNEKVQMEITPESRE